MSRQPPAPRRVAHPHRGVRIARTERQVLGHALDEPQRQTLERRCCRAASGSRSCRTGTRARARGRARGRCRRAARRTAARCGACSGSVTPPVPSPMIAADDVGLLEIGMRWRRGSSGWRPRSSWSSSRSSRACQRSAIRAAIVDRRRAPPGRSRCRSARSSAPGNQESYWTLLRPKSWARASADVQIEFGRIDVVERLDHLRLRQVRLKQFRVVVESLSSSGIWPSRCG